MIEGVKMILPQNIVYTISELERNGFEAYAVGGCVRDSLLGVSPHDWDICTNAMPETVIKCFPNHTVIKTGIAHGTVTLLLENTPIEITTYRSDGVYSDSRHPDCVQFVRSLEEDVKRRDFTINSLCADREGRIIDLTNGCADIQNKVIRCVGDSYKRFDEDALRIMRALRFSSALGFEVEESTKRAALEMKDSLKKISAERLRDELIKLICGRDAEKVLLEYKEIIAVIIPEIAGQFGFCQHNPHHCYDIYTHTVKAVAAVKNTPLLRLTMLLHDIGKPQTFSLDDKGVGHFKLHPTVGSEMARDILSRLRFDNYTKSFVVKQIYEHDNRFKADRKSVRRFIAKNGLDFFYNHLEVRRADALAQSDFMRKEKLLELETKRQIASKLLEEQTALSMRDLAINGSDLIEMGIKEGRLIGEILSDCFNLVIDDKLTNDKQRILDYVYNKYKNIL